MTPTAFVGESFPKSARLLKTREFRFARYKRYQSDFFGFTYQLGGSGRIGISISKKVLRNAAARNRIRRLLKESFRILRGRVGSEGLEVDLHVVALPPLKTAWRSLVRYDVASRLDEWYSKISPVFSVPKKSLTIETPEIN